MDLEPQASQSQDCEPTPPPLQRHGSKTNFFPPPIDNDASRQQPSNVRMYGQARFSPHPRHRWEWILCFFPGDMSADNFIHIFPFHRFSSAQNLHTRSIITRTTNATIRSPTNGRGKFIVVVSDADNGENEGYWWRANADCSVESSAKVSWARERIFSPISLIWDTRKRVETLISLLECAP